MWPNGEWEPSTSGLAWFLSWHGSRVQSVGRSPLNRNQCGRVGGERAVCGVETWGAVGGLELKAWGWGLGASALGLARFLTWHDSCVQTWGGEALPTGVSAGEWRLEASTRLGMILACRLDRVPIKITYGESLLAWHGS